MQALKYTSREVNRNFRIKVSGLGIHELKGFTGFVGLVGSELANNLLDRAFRSQGGQGRMQTATRLENNLLLQVDMKTKILAIPWWLSLVAFGGAMDADPISWVAVAVTFAAFVTLSAAIIREQRKTA